MWGDSRNQIGLEFVQIDIQRSVETKRCSDRRNNLSNQSVEVGEAGRNHAKILLANIIDSLVVDLCNDQISTSGKIAKTLTTYHK